MMRNSLMKVIILILFFLTSTLNIAHAECNFKIKLGQKISKIKKFTDINQEDDLLLENYYISTEDICPNENLEDTDINYTFINDKLASIRLIVKNDKSNTASNKLLLMKYVKQNYGNFDTGQNSKIYNYFNSWKNNDEIIIYKRIKDQFEIIDEELFITNEENNEKLMKINAKIEKGEIKG